MKNVAKFGIMALLLVGLVGSAFAFGGGSFGNEAARKALEAGDYSAWKEAVAAGLTEEKFDQMVERHNAKAEKRAERQAMMDEACETGVLPEDLEGPRAEWLEENLESACQIHEARQNGADREEIKELAEELGLERPECKMRGHGRGMFRQSAE